MANRKSAGPAGPGEVKAAWFMPEQLARVPIDELVPYARNARTHSESQIAQIRASLREFGFVNPVLIDSDRNIIAGHGRVLAAKAEGMTEVPCVLVEHLTDAQRRAYILADNRLAEQSGWDTEMLALELGEIKADGMDLALTGFDAETMILDDPAALADTLGESKSKSGEAESKPDTPETDTPDAAALAAEAFEAGMAAAEAGEESEEYQAFVDKFKPKKTTDDCYTPAPVYEAVKTWAVDKYGLAGRTIVRPFYPGGDYQKMTYPDGAVVIDNPPFSILAEIVDFYHAHNIDFFPVYSRPDGIASVDQPRLAEISNRTCRHNIRERCWGVYIICDKSRRCQSNGQPGTARQRRGGQLRGFRGTEGTAENADVRLSR